MKKFWKFIKMIFCCFLWGYLFYKEPLPISIITSVFAVLDYLVWIRGGNAYLFGDITKTEKKLRKIQKLQIERKLRNLIKE